MMKLSILIAAKESVTGPVRRIRAAIGAMTRGGTRDVARLSAMMDRLGRTAHRIGGVIGRSLRVGLIGATAAATGFIASIIGTAAKFEQFQVMLEGTEGSAARAKRAMAWVRKFAQQTPYEVDEVTAAFVRARGVGIDPMHGALTSLGDAAGATNKTIMDAVEALADAQTGEFERLKEFNITSSTKGQMVAFSYLTKAGKNATKSVRKDMASIQQAVLDIFAEKYGGGMERQSRTLIGMWSNLKDMLAGFTLDVGQAGFFDFIKGQVQQLLGWVNRLAGSGELTAWAKRVSDGLVSIGRSIAGVSWPELIGNVAAIARGFITAGRGLLWFAGGVKGLIDLGVAALITRISIAAFGLATALGFAAGPAAAVIAIVGSLAYGAYKLIANWSKVTAFFGRMWAGWVSAWKTGARMLWNSLPAWLRGILTGASFAIKLAGNLLSGGSEKPFSARGSGGKAASPGRFQFGAPGSAPGGFRFGAPAAAPARPMVYRQPAVAQPRAQGDVRLHITTDQGAKATVKKLSTNSRDFNIDVTRGRVAFG